MSNFLDFLNKKQTQEDTFKMFNEAYEKNNMQELCDEFKQTLKSELNTKVLCVGDSFPFRTVLGNTEYRSVAYFVDNEHDIAPVCFLLNFELHNATEIYSISFLDNFDVFYEEKGKAVSTIILENKQSFGYLIPVILHICETRNYRLTNENVIKQIKKHLSEGKVTNDGFYLRHYEFNGLHCNIFEAISDELKEFKRRLRKQEVAEYENVKGKSDKTTYKDINADYKKVKDAIDAGAENIEDLDLTFKSNLTIKILQEVSEQEAQAKIEEERENFEDLKTVWKEMQQYIKLVIKGLNPALIIAGAPGVGKTYRVRQQLRAAGYQEGYNLWTIKGKCTPRQLYLALYEFKRKGDIIVIDDADGLVGPKAPEDVINILKSALDSTADDEGRLVSYGITGKLLDDEGVSVPKRFYYNGGVIVITNYNAGQLDTALRGRSYIQDINFSIDSILQIIEDLLPVIDKEKLSMDSKEKAFEYLKEIAKDMYDKIEISIRTFSICARIFESADKDFSDDDCKWMILKQLKLQALRGGKKY